MIPPNFINDNDIRADDIQFDVPKLKELRSILLPYSSNKIFPKKIFISRKNTTSGRRKFNEDEVIELFSGLGFEVIYPETLSIRDQIALFHQAEYIAGGSGAAFTNILFCNEQSKCIIFSKLCLPISVFSTIAHVVGADLRYITEEAIKGKNGNELLHDAFEINIVYLKKHLSLLGL